MKMPGWVLPGIVVVNPESLWTARRMRYCPLPCGSWHAVHSSLVAVVVLMSLPAFAVPEMAPLPHMVPTPPRWLEVVVTGPVVSGGMSWLRELYELRDALK